MIFLFIIDFIIVLLFPERQVVFILWLFYFHCIYCIYIFPERQVVFLFILRVFILFMLISFMCIFLLLILYIYIYIYTHYIRLLCYLASFPGAPGREHLPAEGQAVDVRCERRGVAW